MYGVSNWGATADQDPGSNVTNGDSLVPNTEKDVLPHLCMVFYERL